jgi:hypothetical protein
VAAVGQAAGVGTDTDEDRWAEAQSILDRTPTESAARRLRRSKRGRWLLILGITVGGLAVAVAVAFLLGDGPDPGAEVSTGRAVAGFGMSGLGLLLMAIGLFWQIRAVRRARGYGSPVYVLTRPQRKELLAQVRGRAPAQPARVPLARHLAELLQAQQVSLVPQAGLLVNFVGLWIATPSTWRLVLIGVFVPVVLVAVVLTRRETQRAQRFLDAHPALPQGDSAA